MPDPVIRPARLDEIEAMIAIETNAAQLFDGTGLIDLTDLDVLSADIHAQAISEGMSFIALMEGQPAGFVLGDAEGAHGWLHELDVDPAFQRRGLGARLVETFCDHCRSLGLRAVYLSTFRSVPWNELFYAHHGFVELPRSEYFPRMHEIERIQAATLDVSKRLFMRRKL